MENFTGFLHIRIKRGFNLAIRDVFSSDPYVVVKSGEQTLTTHVVKNCLNPKWNEDLTLRITDPNQSVKLVVYDKDTYKYDDEMGDAEINIKPFLEAVKMKLNSVSSGVVINRIRPNSQNCLVEESSIRCVGGKPVQNMLIRLRNVEQGLIEIELQWSSVRYTKDQYGFTRIDSW